MRTGRERVRTLVVVATVLAVVGCGSTPDDPDDPDDPDEPTTNNSSSTTAGSLTASTTPGPGTSTSPGEDSRDTTASSSPTVGPSEVTSETSSERRTEAGGWLGGTPPAAVVAHFDASGMAFQYAQCVVTLTGPTAPSGPDVPVIVPVIVLDPALVEAITVGRLASRDADLDVATFQVGGTVWDTIPVRLPPRSGAAGGFGDVPSDDLDLVPLDEVPVDEQVLDPAVLRDLVTLPPGALLDVVGRDGAATGPAVPGDELELIDPDGAIRRVDALGSGDWDDLRIELDPTADEDQALPVPPADLDFDAIVLADNVTCGIGWTPDAFVHLTIVDAAGTTHVDTQVQVDASGDLSVVWVPDPATAPGPAVVTVDDGSHVASDTVTVVPATSPRVAVLGSQSVPAGGAVRVGLSGFEGGEEVAVQAYRRAEGSFGWDWVGAPPSATVDGDGQAAFEIATTPTDPTARYCLVLPGRPPLLASHCSNAGFDLVAP